MSQSAFYSIVELSIVFGLLLVFILYQIWSVRKRPDGTRGDDKQKD
jgi:hypothetical protein